MITTTIRSYRATLPYHPTAGGNGVTTGSPDRIDSLPHLWHPRTRSAQRNWADFGHIAGMSSRIENYYMLSPTG
jgi:hypothetical protein